MDSCNNIVNKLETYVCPICLRKIMLTVNVDKHATTASDTPKVNIQMHVYCPTCSNTAMVQIDKHLVSSVMMLWETGIKTRWCCEGHLGKWNRMYEPTDIRNIVIGLFNGPYIDFDYSDGLLEVVKDTIATPEYSDHVKYYVWNMAGDKSSESHLLLRVYVIAGTKKDRHSSYDVTPDMLMGSQNMIYRFAGDLCDKYTHTYYSGANKSNTTKPGRLHI